MRYSVAAIICMIICLLAASGAMCSPVLDQDFYYAADNNLTTSIGPNEVNTWQWAQTIRVGMTGTLARVEFPKVVWFDGTPTNRGDVVLAIIAVDGNGVPLPWSTGKLLQTTKHLSDIPAGHTSLSFDLTTVGNLSVVNGQRLALGVKRVSSSSAGGYLEIGGSAGGNLPAYNYGEIFDNVSPGSDNWQQLPGLEAQHVDWYFRTYVTPVPEPSSVFSLICGLGSLCGLIRKRVK